MPRAIAWVYTTYRKPPVLWLAWKMLGQPADSGSRTPWTEDGVAYLPGESDSGMFGGNSSWRGPIWMPVNGLVIRALLHYYAYFGDDVKVECPTRSGRLITLYQVAEEITSRLSHIFLRDAEGRRPVYGGTKKFQQDPHWRDLILFCEYFHGDTVPGWARVIRPDGPESSNDTSAGGRNGQAGDDGRRRINGGRMNPVRALRSALIEAARYPSLYQINTRVWLTALSRTLGRRATLDDVPDDELDRLAELGFDWIWLLSVWQTGAAARQISRTNAEWRHEFQNTLPDLREEDIAGSGFAITGYTVHPALGGDSALARIRQRLRDRGLRLMLDFVPNHTAPDHPWVEEHPDYYVAGTEFELAQAPQNYTRVRLRRGDKVLALGRDPYFAGWPDTLQLDYSNPATQEAMRGELLRIAGQCDGVRCDMAMLVLPDVFERTWGRRAPLFWPEATRVVRERSPGFCFMAEVYWDREWTMQQQGFDYAYDKRLYDRLRDGHARPVREHLLAGLDYQAKLARFMENHDEPRAAATFAPGMHEAAAIITYLSPALRFFHQGQFEGCSKRISPHLVRAPVEPTDDSVRRFYDRLLAVVEKATVRDGDWRLLECVPAWDGNWTWDGFLAFGWQCDRARVLVVVNYAGNQGQCHVRMPFADLSGRAVGLTDLMNGACYERDGSDLASRGLYVDLPSWGYHVFEVEGV